MTRSGAEEECKTLGEAYDEGYHQGRTETIDKLEQKLRIWDNKANAIPVYVWHCLNEMKEQKE